MTQNNLSVLVVEDNKLALKVATMTLAPLGYNIDTAMTGSEALDKLAKNKYSIIFMDLGLPDMDGYTVTETIRTLANKTSPQTPIIALTAHNEDKFRQNALAAGMDDFLSKPLSTDKAKEMIEKYVKQRQK